MDIIEIIKAVIGESATATLAIVALWWLRQLYEEKVKREREHAALRIQEREEYACRVREVNDVLVVKLEEGNKALATSTEVVRQNTTVLQSLQRLLEEK